MNEHRSFDAIVIGGGPAGHAMACDFAAEGKTVALIEKDKLGGTCLNRGCIPTKCLLANSNKTYAEAREHIDEVVRGLRTDLTALPSGVELIEGEAEFIDQYGIKVGNDSFSAPCIVIATGSRPTPLRCLGAEFAVDSNDVLSMPNLPEGPMLIVGGGVIGLEFACIFAGFGVNVSVVEFCPEVLPGLDAELAKRLRMALRKRGIEIHVGTSVEEIRNDGTVICRNKKGVLDLQAALVVAAVGRRPVLPKGLENAGIKLTERGFIEVNPETMATSAEGIYAIGDVNGLCMLAHAAEAQARRVAGKPINLDVIPSVVFTKPELASVGRVDGGSVVKVPYGANGKAQADGEAEGLLKMVWDPESGRILGVHVLGAHADALVAEATLAIANGLTVDALASTVHAHPTLSELLRTAALRTK